MGGNGDDRRIFSDLNFQLCDFFGQENLAGIFLGIQTIHDSCVVVPVVSRPRSSTSSTVQFSFRVIIRI